MWTTVSRMLSLPDLGLEERERVAEQLYRFLLVCLPLAAGLSILMAVFTSDQVSAAVSAVMVGVDLLFIAMMRRGKVGFVSVAVIGALFAGVVVTTIASDGIHSAGISISFASIVLASVLGGSRATVVTAAATGLFMTLTYWAEVAGLLATDRGAPPIHDLLSHLTAVTIVTVVVRLMVGQNVRQAHSLRMTNRQLRAIRHSLQLRTDELSIANEHLQREIAERELAEAVLRQKQKLESIGLLAGGVAHDFNNLLTGILGQTSIAMRKLPANHPARANIDKAIAVTVRATELTRQLLAYAGKGSFQIEPVDLNRFIRSNEELLTVTIAGAATVVTELTDDLPNIATDRGQLQQVLFNLVINAAEALQDGQRENDSSQIVVRTCREPFSPRGAGSMRTLSFADTQMPSDAFVRLTVEDNGRGMDEATLDQIFDPFFSTKDSGRGLGLSAVLGIVRGQNGTLQVHSQPGGGSSFHVYFNVSQRPEKDRHYRRADTVLMGKARAVLVIDDEEPVRAVVREALDARGFRVLAAADGACGLRQFCEHQQDVALVLLDMQMPDMDGEETFHRLESIDPSVKVILSSGYSVVDISRRPFFARLSGYLQKPYDIDKLYQSVAEVIDSADRELEPLAES